MGEKFGHNYFEKLWFMIVAFVVKWDPYKQKFLHVIEILYPHHASRVAFAVLCIWRKISRK